MATLVTIVAALALSPVSAEEGQDYDVDYGDKYSMTLQFVFSGSDAESILWEFGDGESSTEWNPRHTYAETGVYYVTQTTTNSYNGGSTTVQVYRVNVCGYPAISFESNGGSAVSAIQMTAYNVAATEPEAPTREGYTFAGWYTDALLLNAYDWSTCVVEPFTLYAKWTSDAPTEPETVLLHFDVAGGSVSIVAQSVEAGSTAILPSYYGTLSGYEFAGWSVAGIVKSPGDVITVSEEMTVTAVWKAVSVDPVTPEDPEDDNDNDDNDNDDHSQDGKSGLTTEMLIIVGVLVLLVAVVAVALHARRP